MILQLSKDIKIQQESDGKPAGELIYKKSLFGVWIDLQNIDILNDSFSVVFKVIRLEDEQIIATLPSNIPISPEGRDGKTVLNQAEVDAYLLAKANLESAIETAKGEVKILRDEFKVLKDAKKEKDDFLDLKLEEKATLEAIQDPTQEDLDAIAALEIVIETTYAELQQINADYQAKAEEVNAKDNQLQQLRDESNALQVVKPEYEKVDKYEDIIDIKIKNNKLTDDGVIWVKGLPFMTGKLGDYIV